MTLRRYQGPGDGIDLPILRSGARPEVARSRRRSARSSTTANPQGSRYGRFVSGGRPLDTYTLTYPGLTEDEARELVRSHEAIAGRGATGLYYSPEDGAEPIEVHMISRPTITLAGTQSATVSVVLEQQR